MYFPRNWEFGSALSKHQNFGLDFSGVSEKRVASIFRIIREFLWAKLIHTENRGRKSLWNIRTYHPTPCKTGNDRIKKTPAVKACKFINGIFSTGLWAAVDQLVTLTYPQVCSSGYYCTPCLNVWGISKITYTSGSDSLPSSVTLREIHFYDNCSSISRLTLGLQMFT
jgi:hypothetical protein